MPKAFAFGIGLLVGLATATVAATTAQDERVGSKRAAWPFLETVGDDAVAFNSQTPLGAVSVRWDGSLVHELGARGGERVVERAVGDVTTPQGGRASHTRVRRIDSASGPDGVTLASYDEIQLGSPWPGVRMSLANRSSGVERIFEISPGADPGAIRLAIEGVRSMRLEADGSLALAVGARELRLTAPMAWQEMDGLPRAIPVEYSIAVGGYGFLVGPYDHDRPLWIDPILRSTFVGGTGSEIASAVAVGADRVYVASSTTSSSFPPPAPSPTTFGTAVLYIAAYSLDLTVLHELTFLGGTGFHSAKSLLVTNDAVFLVGGTAAVNFPGTATGAVPSPGGGTDGYIARLTLDLGSLERATYFGGSGNDEIFGLALSGGLYVVGTTSSDSLPALAGAAQPSLAGIADSFAARFSPDLSQIVRSTYVGGSSSESSTGQPVLSGDSLYLTGESLSPSLPALAGGFQTSNNGAAAFVSRLSLDLTQILQSTFFGGDTAVDSGFDLALDGDVYLVGRTNSSDLPGTAGGAQSTYSGSTDLFVARFAPTLQTLVRASYLGGSGSEEPGGVALLGGEIFIAGASESSDFPAVSGGAQPVRVGPSDAVISRLASDLTAIHQSTFLGGATHNSATDMAIGNGVVYVVGSVDIDDFPGTATGAQPSFAGGSFDGFLSALSTDLQAISTVGIGDAATLEGDAGTTPLSFTIAVSAPPASAASVDVTVFAGSASAGSDFVLPAVATITFLPDGPTSQSFIVDVNGDSSVEADEVLVVELSNAQGLDIEDSQGTGTILNDDESIVEVPAVTAIGLALLGMLLAVFGVFAVRRRADA